MTTPQRRAARRQAERQAQRNQPRTLMPNPNGQPPPAIPPQPVPTTWRITPLQGHDNDGNALKVIRLDLATPTGVHTTFFANDDARQLRDALTEQLSGIAIVDRIPPPPSAS